MKSVWTKAVLLIGAAAVTMSVTACNTTKGAGKDIEKAGESIQNTADRHD